MPLFGKKKKGGEDGEEAPKKEKKKKEKKPKKEKPPKEKKPKKEKPPKEKKPKKEKPPKKEKKKKGKDAPPPDPGAEGEEEGGKKKGLPKILLIVPVFVLAAVGAFVFLRLRGGSASKYPDGSTLVSEQVLVLSEGTVIFSSDGTFVVRIEDDEIGSDGEEADGEEGEDGGERTRLSSSAFVIAEGAVVESDGSVVLPDGILEFGEDGEIFLPDGGTVLSDGTYIAPPEPEPMDPQDTPERERRDPGMTMGQVVSYFRNLDPRILDLDARSMDEYDIVPVEGSIKVDGQPCGQVQIYERGASGYNAVRGVFLVTRSGSRHVYRYDPASRSVTEVDLTPIDQRPDPITLEPAYQAGYQAGYEAGLAAARAEARREAEIAAMEGAEGD